jgi:hypothetical protein
MKLLWKSSPCALYNWQVLSSNRFTSSKLIRSPSFTFQKCGKCWQLIFQPISCLFIMWDSPRNICITKFVLVFYIGRCWFRRWTSITDTNWNSVQHRKASFWLCLYSCRLCEEAAFVINSEHLGDVLYWIDLLSNDVIKWMRVTSWGGFVVSSADCAVRDVGLPCFETMWFALLHNFVAKPFVLHS